MKNIRKMNKMKHIAQSMMVLMAVVLLMTAAGGCQKDLWFNHNHFIGSGNVISEVRNVGYFSGIRLSGSGIVYVTQGPDLHLEIQAEDNIMPIISTRVSGETLVVDTDYSFSSSFGIKIYVTMPDIHSFELQGDFKVLGQNRLHTGNLDIEITGTGYVELDVDADKIFTEISGAGHINLSGSADSHSLVISGAGNLQAENLEVKVYDIVVSGSGNCWINVLQTLSVSITGSGNVYYRGNPGSVISNISGTGKVVKM
jgi:hypothetical protein